MSIIKLAAPGAGFARLQAIGLGEKTLKQYAGSDWLKNAPIKKVVEKVVKPITEVPKIISKVTYDQGLKKLAASSKEAFLSKLKHLKYTDLNRYTSWTKIPKKDKIYDSLHHELKNLHNSASKSILKPENNILHERVKEYSKRVKELIKKDKRLNLLDKLKNIPKHQRSYQEAVHDTELNYQRQHAHDSLKDWIRRQ